MSFIDSCKQAHLMLSKKSKHISVHQPSSVKASLYSILSVCSLVYCGDHRFTPTTFNRCWESCVLLFSNAALSHVYRCFAKEGKWRKRKSSINIAWQTQSHGDSGAGSLLVHLLSSFQSNTVRGASITQFNNSSTTILLFYLFSM